VTFFSFLKFNKMAKGRDNKPHIGIFGRRNVGKSSFINALVGQEIAIVSDQAGTTTDPVKKSIEIFGIGPAIIIDTAGIDDSGELGRKRIAKSLEALKTIDCAVLMISGNIFGDYELDLIHKFGEWDIPYIIVSNKSDIEPLQQFTEARILETSEAPVFEFSANHPVNIEKILDGLKKTIPESAYFKTSLLGDIVKPGDYVLLITPIDNEAPDGRMILPQQMAIRDVLDNNAINIVLKEDQVENFIKNSGIKPRIAITDSQVFHKMKKIIPVDIPLTSFSIIFARMKGDFENYKKGTPALDLLKDGDRVLILESCSHQVNCDDIGRYKLPDWITKHSKKKIEFDIVAGLTKVERDFKDYALVVQCGGCMVTRKQLSNRLKPAVDSGIPVTNYGLAIAWMNGIFERAIEPFNKVNSKGL
jgi:[FeFe] hydrogenase H-cluster maturation GTPase HydF